MKQKIIQRSRFSFKWNNWHEGVIGIVAARLKDKFNKPVIIISIEGEIGKLLQDQLLVLILVL